MLLLHRNVFSVSSFFIWAAVFSCKSVDANLMMDPEEHPMYCFQCNSGLDLDCKYLQANDFHSYHYKPCLDTEKYNGTKPFCRKIVQKIFPRENMERVIRKCGWIRHPRLACYNTRNEDHIETICQCFDPGCNGSPSLRNHFLSMFLAVLVLLRL